MGAGEAAKREPNRKESSGFANLWLQLLSSVIALALFAVVVLFVQATPSAQWRSDHRVSLSDLDKKDVSTTLGVLRLAQGVLAAITASALTEAFVFLQWKLMTSPEGLSYHSLLGLSPTTGNLGTMALIIAAAPKLPSKLWALMRYASQTTEPRPPESTNSSCGIELLSPWPSGLPVSFCSVREPRLRLLSQADHNIVDTSFVTVFDTVDTYNVTGGVGTFNASLVDPFLKYLNSLAPGYDKNVLPYTYYAAAYTLLLNPLISTISEPVACTPGSGVACFSYLLSGGLEMVTPWAPRADWYTDHPMVRIEHIPAMQLDFQSPLQNDSFADADCDVFGEDGVAIGIRLCVSQVASHPESLRAGTYIISRCRSCLSHELIRRQVSLSAPTVRVEVSVSN